MQSRSTHFKPYYFLIPERLRPCMYLRPLSNRSRAAALVATWCGCGFSAAGAVSVPFFRGGCPSSPSPGCCRRFLVSAWELRPPEQVHLALRSKISLRMASISSLCVKRIVIVRLIQQQTQKLENGLKTQDLVQNLKLGKYSCLKINILKTLHTGQLKCAWTFFFFAFIMIGQ